MDKKISNDEAVEICNRFQELLKQEKLLFLKIPFSRIALKDLLFEIQAGIKIRRVSAIELSKVVSMVRYGKDNEEQILHGLTPLSISFIAWIKLRDVVDKNANKDDESYKKWASLEGSLIELRNKIIEGFCHRIPMVRRKIGTFDIHIEQELDNEGVIGLAYSIEKFDEKKCPSFQMYADLWIRSRMSAHLIKNPLVSIPPDAINEFNKVKNKIYDLVISLGRKLSRDEIDDIYGKEIEKFEAQNISLIRLDKLNPEDEDGSSLHDFITNDGSPEGEILEDLDRKCCVQHLYKTISTAGKYEKPILLALMGPLNSEVKNWVQRKPVEGFEIAQILGTGMLVEGFYQKSNI